MNCNALNKKTHLQFYVLHMRFQPCRNKRCALAESRLPNTCLMSKKQNEAVYVEKHHQGACSGPALCCVGWTRICRQEAGKLGFLLPLCFWTGPLAAGFLLEGLPEHSRVCWPIKRRFNLRTGAGIYRTSVSCAAAGYAPWQCCFVASPCAEAAASLDGGSVGIHRHGGGSCRSVPTHR